MKLLEYVNLEVVETVKGKDLLTWFDFTSTEVKKLLELASALKILAMFPLLSQTVHLYVLFVNCHKVVCCGETTR